MWHAKISPFEFITIIKIGIGGRTAGGKSDNYKERVSHNYVYESFAQNIDQYILIEQSVSPIK